MNSIPLTHGNAYTSDPDYNEFLGGQYVRTIYDWSRRCWVRCTMQAPKTPRDSVPVSDIDLQMSYEPWECDDPQIAAAVAGKKIARVKRDAALTGKIEMHLTECGPMSANRIAEMLKVGSARTLRLLRQNTDRFVFRGGQFSVWSLIGQEYKPKPQKTTSKNMIAIRDAIQAHGPQTLAELSKRLNAHKSSINNSLTNHPDWFQVVGNRPRIGNVPNARIWGVVEAQETNNNE